MTPRRRVSRGTALFITAIIAAAAILPSGSLPKRTLFPVRSARLHQKGLFPLGQGAATTFYAKRDAHHIRCSAVALSGNLVCRAANDDYYPSTATATAGASSTGAQQQAIVHRADSDTAAASAFAEGEERTVVGEIVLSDWLEELPLASLTLPGAGQRSREGKHDDQQGRVEVVSNQQHGQRGGRGEEQGEEDISAPFRFQQVIQHMWAELSRGDQLEYLGEEGQAKVKGALTVLAAYGALREHPLQAGVNSPQQAFSEMDFNMDGEVSFDEFVRWYSMSSALDEQEQDPPQSDAAPPPTPTTPTASAAAGEAAAAAAAPTVAVAAAKGDPTVAPPAEATTLARAERAATGLSPPPAAGGRGASRLLSDLEKSFTRADRTLGTAAPIQQRSPISTVPATAPTLASVTVPATAQATAPAGRVAAESAASRKRPIVLVPSVGSLTLEAAIGAGLSPTEAEKEAARERWLAGGVSNVG
ncbi:unnamed protein product, partial [Laminaria digitata]